MTNGIGRSKMDLVREVSERTGLDKRASREVVDETFNSIKAVLGRGEQVSVRGFGTFTVSKRAARRGRNPVTGEPIKLPASKNVRFKPGKDLKDVGKR